MRMLKPISWIKDCSLLVMGEMVLVRNLLEFCWNLFSSRNLNKFRKFWNKIVYSMALFNTTFNFANWKNWNLINWMRWNHFCFETSWWEWKAATPSIQFIAVIAIKCRRQIESEPQVLTTGDFAFAPQAKPSSYRVQIEEPHVHVFCFDALIYWKHLSLSLNLSTVFFIAFFRYRAAPRTRPL